MSKFKVGLLFGFVWGSVAFGLFMAGFKEARMESLIAKGEIACEYHYGERVCWNPKEDEGERQN